MQVSRLTEVINKEYQVGTEERKILQFNIYGNEYAIIFDDNKYYIANIFTSDNNIRINIFTEGMNYTNTKSFIKNYW